MKLKKSVALPEEMYKWAIKQCEKTGESFSAFITRILIDAKAK